jgi:two-component system C4-dicarboxylate transport response regulator DctD
MTGTADLTVVLVEDDDALGQATVQALVLGGARAALFGDAQSALKTIDADFPGVVVSDVRLPGMDGLNLFDHLRRIDPEIPVIFTTGHGDVAMAVEAMKNGAADFFTKPFSSAELLRAVEGAAQKRALVLENRRLREALGERMKDRILGSSAAAEQLRNVVAAVARSEVDVVLEGDLGTGKTFTARIIHDLSPRRDRPFVTIDAAVLAHEDAELLLFGREPAAGLSRTGLIERANGGTLFLDEVESASATLLARLMAALQSRSVLPTGADRPRKLNLRIIAACGESAQRGAAGSAPHQFVDKLAAVSIKLPPLAARREDIAEIFRYFVGQHGRDLDLVPRSIGEHEWRRIQMHDWPGNLRELSNYARSFVLGLSDASSAVHDQRRSLQDMVAEFEKELLVDALREARGNVAKVQAKLQTPRKTLYDKFDRHRLVPRSFR